MDAVTNVPSRSAGRKKKQPPTGRTRRAQESLASDASATSAKKILTPVAKVRLPSKASAKRAGSPRTVGADTKQQSACDVPWGLIEGRYKRGETDIRELAEEFGVDPAVVAGRAYDERWARDRDEPRTDAALEEEPENRDARLLSHRTRYREFLSKRRELNSVQGIELRFLMDHAALLGEVADLRDKSGPDENGRWQIDQENAAFRKSLTLLEISRLFLEHTKEMASIFEEEDKEYVLYGKKARAAEDKNGDPQRVMQLMAEGRARGEAENAARRALAPPVAQQLSGGSLSDLAENAGRSPFSLDAASPFVAVASDGRPSDLKANSATILSQAEWALMRLRFEQGLATPADLGAIYGVSEQQVIARARMENWKHPQSAMRARTAPPETGWITDREGIRIPPVQGG